MKRSIMVIVLAVLVLGLAVPKPSEANGAWVPAAVIGGMIFGAALTHAAHAAPVYVAPVPGSVYACPPRAPIYVNPPRVHLHYYHHGHGVKRGYWHQRGPLPSQHRRDRGRR